MKNNPNLIFRKLCVFSALAILAGVPLFATVSFGASGISLVTTITVRNNPTYLAFNPSNGYVYVSNYHNDARGSISIINGVSNKVLKNVIVGNGPSEIIYNPSNKEVYAANQGSNTVSVLKGTRVVATIGVGVSPSALVFDPTNKEVYVANNNAPGTVSVISSMTNKVVKTIAVGDNPTGIANDPDNNEIYVMNSGAGTVSAIDASTNKVVSTLNLGISAVASDPEALAFDPANGYMYIGGTSTLTVLDSFNNVVTTVNVGGYFGIVYDPSNTNVYAAGDNVYIISSATDKVLWTVSSIVPAGEMAFNPSNTDIYAIGSRNTVSAINGSTNGVDATVAVQQSPTGIIFDSSNTYIYVTNFNGEFGQYDSVSVIS